jgi:hypothetical protein
MRKILAIYEHNSFGHSTRWIYDSNNTSFDGTITHGALTGRPPFFLGDMILNNNRPISELLLDRDPDLVLADPPMPPMPLHKRCSRFFLETMRRAVPFIFPLAIGVVAASTQGCE